MSNSRWQKLIVTFFVSAFVLCIGFVIKSGLHQANEAADYSAHAALTQEICDQLEAISARGPYPESLSQIELTYPDGGDPQMLTRFEYRRTATGCSLRTVIGDQEFSRSFARKRLPVGE